MNMVHVLRSCVRQRRLKSYCIGVRIYDIINPLTRTEGFTTILSHSIRLPSLIIHNA